MDTSMEHTDDHDPPDTASTKAAIAELTSLSESAMSAGLSFVNAWKEHDAERKAGELPDSLLDLSAGMKIVLDVAEITDTVIESFDDAVSCAHRCRDRLLAVIPELEPHIDVAPLNADVAEMERIAQVLVERMAHLNGERLELAEFFNELALRYMSYFPAPVGQPALPRC